MRAFVAAPISSSARREIASYATGLRGAFRDSQRRSGPATKKSRQGASKRGWVAPENYHVTLRFLGEIEASRTAAISDALSTALAGQTAFCAVTGALFWMRSHRSRKVLSLALSPADAWQALAERVETGLATEGFPRESRAFLPHLTLARIRNLRGDPLDEAREGPLAVDWKVSEIALYESRLGPGGARYTELSSLPLQPDPAPPEDKQGDQHGSK